ncbi:unnamed protein product [Musa hybrid cultivar]
MTAHWSILLQNSLGSYSWSSLFYDMSKFFFFWVFYRIVGPEKLRTAPSFDSVGILIRLVLIEKGNAPASLDGFKSLTQVKSCNMLKITYLSFLLFIIMNIRSI